MSRAISNITVKTLFVLCIFAGGFLIGGVYPTQSAHAEPPSEVRIKFVRGNTISMGNGDVVFSGCASASMAPLERRIGNTEEHGVVVLCVR